MSNTKTAVKEPGDGPEAIKHLLELVEKAAQLPLENDGSLGQPRDCVFQFSNATDAIGKTNGITFSDCFSGDHWGKSKTQLELTAQRHGELARYIQLTYIDPNSQMISFEAFVAAGAAVRKLCRVKCDGTMGSLGQWCTWP